MARVARAALDVDLDAVSAAMDQEQMAARQGDLRGGTGAAVKQETVAIVSVGVALLVALASFLLPLRGDVRMLSTEVRALARGSLETLRLVILTKLQVVPVSHSSPLLGGSRIRWLVA